MENEDSLVAWLQWSDGKQTPLGATCCLGRGRKNQIVLADEKVSRRHTMVHAQDIHEFWLIDLGSANGTYLNGRRVSHPTRLSDKDQIKIGGSSFTFHHPAMRPPATWSHTTTSKTAQEITAINCWLLVADIESSTQFIQRLPEGEAPRVTGRWLDECKQLIEKHGGTINKFLGDGFFAYWFDRHNAGAAVAAALADLRLQQDIGRPSFRVVLHYGKVFTGGGGLLGEENLSGNEVNFVFRLEKLASSLGQSRLLSQAACDQIKSLLPTAEAGRHSLRGFDSDFFFFSF